MILVDLWTLKVLHLCWNSHNTVFLFPNYSGLCWPFCLFLPVSCRIWRPLQGQKIPSSNVKNRDTKAFFVSFSSNIPEEKTDLKLFLSYSLRLLQTYVVEGGWWYFLLVCGCPPCHVVTTFHICYEGHKLVSLLLHNISLQLQT